MIILYKIFTLYIMLKVHSFTFNPFQENTYIISNQENECLIIDPGMYGQGENDQLFSFIKEHNLKPVKIINTHAHIDHILGIGAVKQKYMIPFGLHELEKPILENGPGSAMLFGLNFNVSPTIDFFIKEGESLRFGDSEINILFTPGHSPGSISFYFPKENLIIAGDVLFNGSVGRTDLPGGDSAVLMNSIKSQLYTLPEHTLVYPGHGPLTNIGHEKRNNPFVKE